ncbi:hypothetical protein LOY64_22720 [Pseudomonas corrugata]|uniref:hypothetical protein n=1 Tax=Pseudomonas corrugata TaxID=47879 RepID=UPI002230E9B0|nr:hypothetical protein [Pseudomonas corrugata]UZD94094.1 hypothetical protein LOY64_22720 [Pseudomonas corrugata]
MTKRLSFSLDLNANDFDALQTVLANPRVVASAVAPNDPWEHARIVDVLVEMAGSVAAALKPAMDCESPG